MFILDIRQLLLSHPNWKVIFTYRDSNHVAHSLAKMVYNLVSECLWIDECPGNVMSLVLLDASCNTFHQ